MINRLKQICKTMIANNINEAELYYLNNINKNSESYNDFLLLKSRITKLNDEINKNLISASEYEISYAKIITSYIYFFDSITPLNTELISSSKYLEVSTEKGTVQALPLLEYDKLMIGRNIDSDVVIPDASVSRKHCSIKVMGNNFIVSDLKSKKGTCLNGVLIKEASFDYDDLIEVGQTKLLIKDPRKTI